MTSNRKESHPELMRKLGVFDTTMILAGIVIGTGIFLTTGVMAKTLPSASLILLAWLAGGVFSLAGALTVAEMGASMPEAGGQYIYLREAYGPLFGFLFGWVFFLVNSTGSKATIAVGFAEYVAYFFPSLSTQNKVFSTSINIFNHHFGYSLSVGQLVAIGAIILLSLCNYVGLGVGKTIQNIFTVIKIGTIVIIIVLGFSIGKGTSIDFTLNSTDLGTGQLIMGFFIVLIAVSWAYDGWINVSFVAGEIKNPGKNLPRALILGTSGITILYLLINYLYLYALPIKEMAGVVRIAEKATLSLFGGPASAIISAVVIISTFSALNSTILTGPRVFYAMAKDKLFFRKVAKVNQRFHTPGFAFLAQAIWAIILTLSGSFEQLLTFTTFIIIASWIANVASVFTLRKKYPNLPRPYKTWGYPAVPIIFLIFYSIVLLNTLIRRPVESLAGVALTVIGIPAYCFWRRKSREGL